MNEASMNHDIPETQEYIRAAKGLTKIRPARKCTNKDGRKVIFSFLALPRSFAGGLLAHIYRVR